jgi:hypothetical protein
MTHIDVIIAITIALAIALGGVFIMFGVVPFGSGCIYSDTPMEGTPTTIITKDIVIKSAGAGEYGFWAPWRIYDADEMSYGADSPNGMMAYSHVGWSAVITYKEYYNTKGECTRKIVNLVLLDPPANSCCCITTPTPTTTPCRQPTPTSTQPCGCGQ